MNHDENRAAQEAAREEYIRERVAMIERLGVKEAERKAEAILVLIDAKPAATMTVRAVDAIAVMEELRKIGFFVATGQSMAPVDDDGKSLVNLHYSKNEKRAEELASTRPGDHKKLGELYGFPRTAVDSFKMKPWPFKNIVSDEIDPSLVVNCAVSSDPEKQKLEIDYLKKWSEAVKKYSPLIYEKALEQKRTDNYDK